MTRPKQQPKRKPRIGGATPVKQPDGVLPDFTGMIMIDGKCIPFRFPQSKPLPTPSRRKG